MKKENKGYWHGFFPPQYIFSKRTFAGIALDPPDFNPGSWIGAGKVLYDSEQHQFLLTARPRWVKNNDRGFAANIYRSNDGISYKLVTSLQKKEAAKLSGLEIHSIEGTQLLKDPMTERWYFYISCDTGSEFVWGGVCWETLLFISDNLEGTWRFEGVVLHNDQTYDAFQARDGSIDIIDGVWFCLYKAKDKNHNEKPALALSLDGIHWEKRGPLTIDCRDRHAFLSGSFFGGVNGPVFMGIETQLSDTREEKTDVIYADGYKIGHGGGSIPHSVSFILDYRNMNMETIHRTPWIPLSEYEHKEHPLLGYSSSIFDPKKNRILMYVEAIDGVLSHAIGINETVERVLVYESKL